MNNQAIEKGPLINDLNKNQGNGNSNNQKLKMLECEENRLNSPQQIQSIGNSSDQKEVMIYVNNNK
jgi:predicted nuclease with TOPRIM domain